MKKLLSCVTAVCLGALTVAPMVSNAIYDIEDLSSPALNKFNDEEKYVKLDKKYNDLIFTVTENMSVEQIENISLYATKNGCSVYALIPTKLMGHGEDYVSAGFNLAEGATEEKVSKLLNDKFNGNFTITSYNYNPNYKYQVKCLPVESKEICDILKEEKLIDSFIIPGGFVQIKEFSSCSETYALNYWLTDDDYKTIEKYAAENAFGEFVYNGLGYSGLNHSEFYLVTVDCDTVEEKLDVALDIYKNTGVRPSYTSPEISNATETGLIDVFNAVNGDANCDKSATMADAAAILQAIGNPDKYALSYQGEFNADYAGDGLTPDDAIAIQKKLAGIE